MAIIEIVNVSTPNDGLGDTLRNSQVKANDNFAELNAKKVEVVAGKDLSDNNFTDTEKDKLAAIAEDAEKNVQPNWNQTDNTADDYILNKPTSSKYLIQNGYSLVDNVLTIFVGWIWVINDNQYTNLVDIEITYPYAAVGYSRLDRVVFTTLSTAVRIAGYESTDTPLAPPIPDSTLEFGISLITEDSASGPIPPDPTDQNNISKTIETTLSAIGSTDWEDDVQINLAQYLSDETIVVSETQIYKFKITNTDGTYQIYEQLNQGKGLIPNDPSKLFLLVDRSVLKQNKLTLTTTGTSGAATLIGSVLNIPNYEGGGTPLEIYSESGTLAGGDGIATIGDYGDTGGIRYFQSDRGQSAVRIELDKFYANIENAFIEATYDVSLNSYDITSGLDGASITLDYNRRIGGKQPVDINSPNGIIQLNDYRNIGIDLNYSLISSPRTQSFQDKSGTIALKDEVLTVATLPTGTIGDTAIITDALAPTYLGIAVGGGAITCKVFYNGTNWVCN